MLRKTQSDLSLPYGAIVSLSYPPLNVEAATPRLKLRGASDDLLAELLPVVRAGVVGPDELPFDDPMSLYEDNPAREWKWLQSRWRARSRTEPNDWRLSLVVDIDGRIVGVQDLIAEQFPAFREIHTFSWLAPDLRGQGFGREMRSAALHLSFEGFNARVATSDAFVDNVASNAISQSLGYQPNGLDRATRRGEAALLQRWRLTRDAWAPTRRGDITLSGVTECWPVFGIA